MGFVRQLLLLLALAGMRGRAGAVTIDGGLSADTGAYSALAVVAGRPAIAWPDWEYKTVKYTRALDGAGAGWGAHVTVDTGVAIGRYIQMVVADGKPAVCYADETNRNIRFVRALNAEGSAWGAPVIINSGGSAPVALAMEVATGHPAICYRFSFGLVANLRYARAADPAGALWNPPVLLNSTADNLTGTFSMRNVQGKPAVVQALNSGLYYIPALDAEGAAWGIPLLIGTQSNSSSYPSLAEVNGRPAILYRDTSFSSSYQTLKYRRATNAEGTVWGTEMRVAPGNGLNVPVLEVVSGKPVFAYYAQAPADLMFSAASDIDGEEFSSWSEPVTLDSTGITGLSATLREVNGLPAVVYRDATQKTLKYLRAVEENGTVRWPAQMVVNLAGDSLRFRSGHTQSFGVVKAGERKTLTFFVSNPDSGSMDLHVGGWTLEGPDAAEFSVTPASLSLDLVAGAAREIDVTCTPVTPGYKRATLRFTHDAEPSENPFEVNLFADSAPSIALEPQGKLINEVRTEIFPPGDPQTPAEYPFTIRNPGGADLHSIVITFEGPGAAELTVAVPPAAVVPPDGSTGFVVRHAALTPGAKTVTMRIHGNAEPVTLVMRIMPGVRDPSFHAEEDFLVCVAVQPDGKVVAGGQSVVRVNADGTPDTGFFAPALHSGLSFPFAVQCVAVQRDGGILIGGYFARIDGQPRPGIARLHADGTLDTSFAPALTGLVYCIVIQPDGKILAGGAFGTEPGGPPSMLARLHPDGTPDMTFNAHLDRPVTQVLLQPDGKIIIGGEFVHAGETAVPRLVRLTADGALDTAFEFYYPPTAIALLPDGNVLAAASGGWMARFLPNGAHHAPVVPASGNVTGFAVQADGACIACGYFSSIGGFARQGIGRLRTDGSLDPGFDCPETVSEYTRLALQPNGKVLATGFNNIGQPATTIFARFANDPAVSELKVLGGNAIRWLRGGSAPEVSDVSFEVKADGSSAWTPPAFAQRIPGGWELSGLTLPSAGLIRAQARAGGSLYESIVPVPSPLESWRMQYFDTTANTGPAANDADPDNDGLTNFVEFAFALSPADGNHCTLPPFIREGNALTSAFSTPPGRENVRYRAEWSTILTPHSWTEISDTGTGGTHRFSVEAAGARVFVRYGVRER